MQCWNPFRAASQSGTNTWWTPETTRCPSPLDHVTTNRKSACASTCSTSSLKLCVIFISSLTLCVENDLHAQNHCLDQSENVIVGLGVNITVEKHEGRCFIMDVCVAWEKEIHRKQHFFTLDHSKMNLKWVGAKSPEFLNFLRRLLSFVYACLRHHGTGFRRWKVSCKCTQRRLSSTQSFAFYSKTPKRYTNKTFCEETRSQQVLPEEHHRPNMAACCCTAP